MSKRFAAGALFGGVFLFICISLPALAQFACTTTATDITCTNTGTAPGDWTNTASGAGQNATTLNSGTVNGFIETGTNTGGNATASNSGTAGGPIFTWTWNGGNATTVNSGTVNDWIKTETNNGGNATTVNSGTAGGDISALTFGGGNATASNSGVVHGLIDTETNNGGNATTSNSGTVSGEIDTWTWGGGNATASNSGVVNGLIDTETNNGGNATTSNSGTVAGDVDTWTWNGGNATASNSGTVGGKMDTGTLNGGNATALNSGTVGGEIVTWTWNGNATTDNSGAVNGLVGTVAFGSGSATTFNSGTVNNGIHTMAFGGGNSITVNSGVVNGVIQTSALSVGNATTINSGRVSNPGQTAIQLDGGNTTLTILPGSFIVGHIKLGGFADTVIIRERNIDLTFDSVNSSNSATVNLANATVTGTVPYVVSGNRIVSVDPTSFGFTDRALMDFTHALSGFLSSAPAGEPGGFKDGNAASFTGANGVTAWAKGFYGQSVQPAEGSALRGVTGLSGGAMGFDGSALPDLRIGAFAGGGAISSSIASNAGSAKSDTGFGGLYGRYNAGAAFLDAALTVGGLSNSTVRANINNNMAANGLETAKASFGGWFAVPEAALGHRYALQDGWSLTPALKLRYLRAGIAGYTETGSAANLTIDARVPQDLEERAELTLARTLRVDSGTDLHVSAHGGVLGLERVGGTAVSGTLLGQGLGFAAPGKDSVAGGYGGLDLDLRIGEQLSLFGAGEYTATNDQGSLVTAKGGLRWQF